MKALTHIAGATIAAIVGMTAIPSDASAGIIGSLGFGPTGAVTFNHGAVSDIIAGITHKEYPGGTVNIPGSGILAGIAFGAPVGGVDDFQVPTGLDFDISDFDLTGGGYTFTFTTADLHELTPTSGTDAGGLVADYQGTITAGPNNVGEIVQITQSCDQSPGAPVNCSNTLTVETTAVPEPGTLGLLSAALIGFGLIRRRRHGV